MEGQAAQIVRLKATMAGTRARAEEMRALLTPGMLQWAPQEGGWNVGQVFEHLVMTTESYLPAIRALITKNAPPAAAEPAEATDREWKPSMMGGWIARALEKPAKISAPGRWRPVSQPRPNVVAIFLQRQAELATLLDASAGLEWQKLRLSSPALALIRMNLGDAFTAMVLHDERHFGQIDRVRSQPGFPKTGVSRPGVTKIAAKPAGPKPDGPNAL